MVDAICPTVAKAATEGFDLDEMRAHMLACEQCKPILDAMTAALEYRLDDDLLGMADDLRMADVPDAETLADWADDDSYEATDGCQVEIDGVCPHGRPSWALVLGLV